MEKVGIPKRDILVSRVESARDSQQDAKQESTGALTEFGRVVSCDGGDLEKNGGCAAAAARSTTWT